MKKYFLTACILSAAIASAQTKQGTVIYERRVDVHRRMQDEQMKAMVPQFRTTKSELVLRLRMKRAGSRGSLAVRTDRTKTTAYP